MKSKLIYTVQHYVPFPQSEYGGLWVVIAENDSECFDLIVEQDGGNFYEQYYSDLRENIMNSVTYPVAAKMESCIVEEFTT
mgnify:FL=1|tara:strand:+ start:1634 stop:1876 length:243 start_codon:yes stop_codon:yes gene_type:complete